MRARVDGKPVIIGEHVVYAEHSRVEIKEIDRDAGSRVPSVALGA